MHAGCHPFAGATTDAGTVYHFYEVYKDDEAMATHKTLDHYKAWATFKAANMETVGASQVHAVARLRERPIFFWCTLASGGSTIRGVCCVLRARRLSRAPPRSYELRQRRASARASE